MSAPCRAQQYTRDAHPRPQPVSTMMRPVRSPMTRLPSGRTEGADQTGAPTSRSVNRSPSRADSAKMWPTVLPVYRVPDASSAGELEMDPTMLNRHLSEPSRLGSAYMTPLL